MRLENDTSGWGRHVSGDRLGLQANSDVHVSFNISSDRIIAVCPLSASVPGSSCVLWGPTGGTTLYGANLNVGSPPGLAFWTSGTGTTVIRDLAIVHNNNNSGLFDFDTADQRAAWTRLNGTTEGPAAIVPLGTGSATGADWAAVLNLGDPSLFSQHTSLAWGNNKLLQPEGQPDEVGLQQPRDHSCHGAALGDHESHRVGGFVHGDLRLGEPLHCRLLVDGLVGGQGPVQRDQYAGRVDRRRPHHALIARTQHRRAQSLAQCHVSGARKKPPWPQPACETYCLPSTFVHDLERVGLERRAPQRPPLPAEQARN
jgi:hypothetical protein